eukprot:GEMP01048499.1.p1 GENE.GEMP01048499.1~~GEMP01048499.1.p1  ORF type:complete len:173 (+),score=39.14 GEMP01048499.1:24-542(+)
MDLFGGAIRLDIPAEFDDVSVIREVPDHQEVYVHRTTNQSLIVEILDYEQVSDDAACNHFFQDLVEANAASTAQIVRKVGPLKLEGVTDVVMICEGTQSAAKFGEAHENVVRTYLAAIRIPQKKTDILVTLNCPEQVHSASSDSAAPPSANEFDTFVNTVLTLRIVDWNLFK